MNSILSPSASETGSEVTLSTTETAPHVHSATCGHPQTKTSKEKVPSGYDMEKDTRSLKASRYGEIKDKFSTTFVIKNKKTGMIVELKAASSTHACKLIGWRPNNVKLIEVREGKKDETEKVTEVTETAEVKEVTEVAEAVKA